MSIVMNADPIVTVVVPTYNCAATLAVTLENLLLQELSSFEVWVVGDGCTDNTGDVVASFGDPRLHWVNLPTNSGSQGAPNNEGVRRARGRFIAYMNHDDLWFRDHLSGLVRHIEETGADVVHSLVVEVRPWGFRIEDFPRNRAITRHFVTPSSWLHRRELPSEIGPWADHVSLAVGPDLEFMRRAWRAGKRIEFLPQLSVLHFPSPAWKTYARGTPPQEAYVQELKSDPAALRARVLLGGAVRAAIAPRQDEMEVRRAARLLGSIVKQRLWQLYGEERWPLGAYLRWKNQRQRQRGRERRGLARYSRGG